jgi:hypothetical protein
LTKSPEELPISIRQALAIITECDEFKELDLRKINDIMAGLANLANLVILATIE